MKTSAPPTRIKLIVADAHSLFRCALVELIGLMKSMTVVGQASNAGEAIDVVSCVNADMIVLDIDMPGAQELSLIRTMKDRVPGLSILILSTHGDTRSMNAALVAGARGYLTKQDSTDVLDAAIRTVAHGGRYISPRIERSAAVPHCPEADPITALSPRERQILQLIVDEGHSQTRIARELGLSPKTVFTHKSNIMRKLGVNNNANFLRYVLSRNPPKERSDAVVTHS